MNSNARMLLAIFIALFICLMLGILALCLPGFRQKKMYMAVMLYILIFAGLGSSIIMWHMQPQRPSFTNEATPLPGQSQVIIQTWEWHASSSRTSFSGKDGSVHWNAPDQLPCISSEITVVVKGILYQRGIAANNQTECIQAIRLSDNKPLWSTSIKATVSSTPSEPPDQLLFANDRLYMQSESIIFILDPHNGQVLRTIQPDGLDFASLQNFAVNDQALVILYFLSTTTGQSRTAYDYKLVSIQPVTGKLLWERGPVTYDNLMALQGSKLYVSSGESNSITALDVHTATKLWQIPQNVEISASMATSDSLYMLGEEPDDHIYAFNASTGQLRWKVQRYEALGTPVVVNNIIYIGAANTFSAYNATSGKMLWQHSENPLPDDSIRFNPYDAIFFSQPVISGKIIFIQSFLNPDSNTLNLIPRFCLGQCNQLTGILALNATTGKLYWRHNVSTDLNTKIAMLTASP